MKKYLWYLRRGVRSFWNQLLRLARGFFFTPTITTLKTLKYRELPANISWEELAKGRRVIVEIGSGHGEVLLANNPSESIIIGYEIKSRFFRLSQRKSRKREDIVIFQGNGYESLRLHYKDNSVDKAVILFPDPWHKKRHSKRRQLTSKFFSTIAQKLKTGGQVIIATDWLEYADFIKNEALTCTKQYEVSISPYDSEAHSLPITHYHQKWVRYGRKFTAIVLTKRG